MIKNIKTNSKTKKVVIKDAPQSVELYTWDTIFNSQSKFGFYLGKYNFNFVNV